MEKNQEKIKNDTIWIRAIEIPLTKEEQETVDFYKPLIVEESVKRYLANS